MSIDQLNASRRSPAALPAALLALVLTVASFGVFFQTERVEVPVSTTATLTERAAGLEG